MRMFLHCWLVGLAVIVTSSAWAEPKTSGQTVVNLQLIPSSPAANQDAVVAVTFTDLKSGKPATVSDVSIVWSMPEMGHDWQTQKLAQRKSGEYSAALKFPMRGKFRASVSAKRGGVGVDAQYTFQISEHTHKGNGH